MKSALVGPSPPVRPSQPREKNGKSLHLQHSGKTIATVEQNAGAILPRGGMSVHGNRRRRSLALLCWLLFAAGLLIQLLSPHLKVSNGAFVIPPEMAAGRNAIRLDEIVARQRRMQLLSVLLTVSGALGLAFLYRDILIGAASRRSSGPVEEPTGRDSTRSESPGATRKTLDEETNR
jgi:hypothetical protein